MVKVDFQASQTAKACSDQRVQSLPLWDMTINSQHINEAQVILALALMIAIGKTL